MATNVIENRNSIDSEVYAVKKTFFFQQPVTFICQNSNGPCPLLAICNVLLLRRHITLDQYISNGYVFASDLLHVVQKRLYDTNPPLPESDTLGRLTQKKTLEDITELLPSLLVGLDVNVRFKSITGFEYTVACAVFDMLDISLVHGWLLDEQDEKTMSVLQDKSYNELIERLVDYRSVLMIETKEAEEKEETKEEDKQADDTSEEFKGDSEVKEEPSSPKSPKSPSKNTVKTLMTERNLTDTDAINKATNILEEGPILEEFFNSTASQLTYYGLMKLHEELRERQLCVFFRNNHFSTLFKHGNSLYLLVTDAGYLEEPTVVWERLYEIYGDTDYLDHNFQPLKAHDTQQSSIIQRQTQLKVEESTKEKAEAQNKENNQNIQVQGAQDQGAQNQGAVIDEDDFAMALRLQNEENERGRAQLSSANEQKESSKSVSQMIANATVNAVTSTTAAVSAKAGTIINSLGNSVTPTDPGNPLHFTAEELEEQRQAEKYYAERKQQAEARQSQSQPPGASTGSNNLPFSAQFRQQQRENRSKSSAECDLM